MSKEIMVTPQPKFVSQPQILTRSPGTFKGTFNMILLNLRHSVKVK